MDIHLRLKELRLYLKETKISFSKVMNLDNSQYGKIEKGVLLPTLTQIMELCSNYPSINTEWILTGRAPMLKEDITAIKATSGLPLVSIKAIGGFGNDHFSIADRDVKDYYVIPKFKHKEIDFMIEVEGSSMYPKYNSGDIVACRIIKERNFIQWNKTHVIATRNQGIIIKRIKKGKKSSLCMVSDNPNYDPFEVPEEEITGIALVVGVIRLE